MRFLLVCLAFLFVTAAMLLDNITTHYALTMYTDQGVVEGNPFARGMFNLVGLTPGLLLNTVLSIGVYIFLVCTRRMTASTKILFLILMGSLRFSAGINNLAVISSMALLGGN